MISDALKNLFLFEGLSDSELLPISELVTEKRLQSGEPLFAEGDSADAFFVVVSGQIKVFKISPQGEEQTLHLHETGTLVAEAAMFGLGAYPAHAQALVPTDLLRVPKGPFVALLKQRPELALKMMSGYAKRLRQFVTMVEQLTLQSVQGRLAYYLLEHSRELAGERVCQLEISKKELASMIGTVPETFSRALAHFRAKGWISGKGKEFVIHDQGALRDLLS